MSYFKGKPEEWKTGLPTYAKVIYRDLWPGIDLVYAGAEGRLKYEFIVSPGADPSRIRLAYSGADRVEVNGDGRLEVRTPAGRFEDDIPVAYQGAGEKRRSIPVAYSLGQAVDDRLWRRAKRLISMVETALLPERWRFRPEPHALRFRYRRL